MELINHYSRKIWVKPETKDSLWLLPGQKINIDGFKPPKWGGDWLKLSGNDGTCTITASGDFILRDYKYGFLSVNTPIFPNKYFYKLLPGRKKDPFSTWKPEPKQ